MKKLILIIAIILGYLYLKSSSKSTLEKETTASTKAEAERISAQAASEKLAAEAAAMKEAEIQRLKAAAEEAKKAGDLAEAARQKAAAELAQAQKDSADQVARDQAEKAAQETRAAALAAQVKAEEAARMEAIAKSNQDAAAKAAAEVAAAKTIEEARKAAIDTTAAQVAKDYAIADQNRLANQAKNPPLSSTDPYILGLNQKFVETQQILNTIQEAATRNTIESYWANIELYKATIAQYIDMGLPAIANNYKRVVDSLIISLDVTIASTNVNTAGMNLQNAVNTAVSGFSGTIKIKSPFR